MSNDKWAATHQAQSGKRHTADDIEFSLCFNRALFEKDADRAATLLAHWLKTHNLRLSPAARRTLLAALDPDPRAKRESCRKDRR